jgi:hypothetical protein
MGASGESEGPPMTGEDGYVAIPALADVQCPQCGTMAGIQHRAYTTRSEYVCLCGCRWPIQQPESD